MGAPAAAVKVSAKAVPFTIAKADRDVAFHIVESFNGTTREGLPRRGPRRRTEIDLSPATIDASKPNLAQATSLTEQLVKRVRAR